MNKFVLILFSFFTLSIQSGFASYEIELNNDKKEIERAFYNFGTNRVNTRSTVTFTITNNGTEKLTFKKAMIGGADFSAAHSCKKGLEPQKKCVFSISYWPVTEGMSYGQFLLSFVEDTHVVVDVMGNSIR